jgi:biotin carboxyl carrier protein
MNEPSLLLRVDRAGDGTLRVLSPGAGWWWEHPAEGTLVGPGGRVGRFSSLNRSFTLVLPEGAAGKIVGGVPGDRRVAVEYGQVLLELAPVRSGEDEGTVREGSAGSAVAADLAEGTRAVVSPTDGVFYRRPSPDAEAFVEVGSRVRVGQALGLVEVMKTFNQIAYGGPGFPDEAEVVEIRAGDAEEVRAGQVLIVVRGA